MQQRQQWMPPEHTRSCPAHHLAWIAVVLQGPIVHRAQAKQQITQLVARIDARQESLWPGVCQSPADVAAYFFLQPKIDVDALIEIERAQVSVGYFKSFDTALGAARIYGHVLISYIGAMAYPDLAAEMANIFLRLQGCEWVICLGVYQDELIPVQGRYLDSLIGFFGQFLHERPGHRPESYLVLEPIS